MNGLTLTLWGFSVVAAVFSGLAIRTTWLSSRFAAVTKAQYARSIANSRLGAAYSRQAIATYKRVDLERAQATVAEAEMAVKVADADVERAESRLPRGRSRRAYFAEKAAP